MGDLLRAVVSQEIGEIEYWDLRVRQGDTPSEWACIRNNANEVVAWYIVSTLHDKLNH